MFIEFEKCDMKGVPREPTWISADCVTEVTIAQQAVGEQTIWYGSLDREGNPTYMEHVDEVKPVTELRLSSDNTIYVSGTVTETLRKLSQTQVN